METAEQLLLNVRPREYIRLSDFTGAAFAPVLAALEGVLAQEQARCYLWSGPESGRRELLTALCGEAEVRGLSSVLLPLSEVLSFPPEMLQGLEQTDLLVLDRIEAVAGNAEWEEGLFHLYNRLQESQTRLVLGAAAPVRELGIRLPDLVSRWQQASVYGLPLPDDAIRSQLLQAGVTRRGLVLEPEVERYLVERGPRPLGAFLDCLERLDRLSLRDQRRLTIPFVREVLTGLRADKALIS